MRKKIGRERWRRRKERRMSRGIAKPGSARTWALAMILYFINPSVHNSCEGSLLISFGISMRLKFTAGDQEAVNYSVPL